MEGEILKPKKETNQSPSDLKHFASISVSSNFLYSAPTLPSVLDDSEFANFTEGHRELTSQTVSSSIHHPSARKPFICSVIWLKRQMSCWQLNWKQYHLKTAISGMGLHLSLWKMQYYESTRTHRSKCDDFLHAELSGYRQKCSHGDTILSQQTSHSISLAFRWAPMNPGCSSAKRDQLPPQELALIA